MEQGRATGWRGVVRAEDALLAAWTIALPIAGGWLGAGGPSDATDRGPMPLIGLVQLVAVLGAIVALLTRPSDQPTVRVGDTEAPRWIISGPLIGGLAFAANSAATNLGFESGDWVIGAAFLAIMVGSLAANHLPTLPSAVRRALVVPFILVCAAFFNGFAAIFLGSFDIGSAMAASPAGGVGFAVFVLALVLAGMAAFYAMFVVAPRELADPEESGPRWVARFAIFVVASLIGFSWLSPSA